MIRGPTVQHIEIGNALLDETTTSASMTALLLMRAGSFYNARVTLRPVGTIHREKSHATVANVDLQPIAVMLQLVRPTRPHRILLGDDWLAGMDESGRRV